MFATKPQLAGDLLQHAHDRGIRAGFVAGDEVYGGLELRKGIRERGTGYALAVRSNYTVTLTSSRRATVKEASLLVNPACGSGCGPGRPPRAPGTTTGP
jgi:SRSO17 transposase